MRTRRTVQHTLVLATMCLFALALAACDDPPAATPDQIDIDAESQALDESVGEVHEKADERVASPAESKQQPDQKDDAPE